jgi:hypothetical protein
MHYFFGLDGYGRGSAGESGSAVFLFCYVLCSGDGRHFVVSIRIQ